MATPILHLLQDAGIGLERRYLSLVIKQDGCWSWRGVSGSRGYARLCNVGGRGIEISGHRLSYAIHFGVDPGDMLVCHRCDNPICTNPDHLFLGTVQDNSDDMVKKGRHVANPMPGERNPRALVTRDEARYIKLAASIRMSNKELGRLFGVHHATISCIKLGKSWPDIKISEDD